MKFIISCSLIMLLSTGCSLSRMLVPDVNNRMGKDELAYKGTVNADFNEAVLTLVKENPLEKDKSIITTARLMLEANRDANKIMPSTADNAMQQYMNLVGRENIDRSLEAGFQWTKEAISGVSGAGAAGTGGLALLFSLWRKKKRLGLELDSKKKTLDVVSAELSPEEKNKVKTALNHTGLEKNLV